MNDDEWQLQAVHEQFDVFSQLNEHYKKIPSTDFVRLMEEVSRIKNCHLKMHEKDKQISLRDTSAEIMKYPDGNEIKLSFVLIVTDIEIDGDLCKMPIFVIISGGKKKFIDMNLTLFNNWETFLNSNDLPSCQFCFPVGGEYNVGRKLKIDFASSPAALIDNRRAFFTGLGIIVAVGVVALSFFYGINPTEHRHVQALTDIAGDFVPVIKDYVKYILQAVTIVSKFKSGEVLEALPKLWKLLTNLNKTFGDDIASFIRKVQANLVKLYNWIKDKVYSFFKGASEWAQHLFIAVTSRVDNEINIIELETEELLEASRRYNSQAQTTVDAAAIHAQVDNVRDAGYANTIFRNAINDSALQHGMKNKDSEDLHPITSDLLSISNSLAEKLGKTTLNEVQDIFEALSDIVKEEYKNKIQTYTEMLRAARAGAGHPIDLDKYNQSLGIEGDPKEHYWEEAMMSTMRSRTAYRVNEKIACLKKQKKILIVELWKKDKDDVVGLYRCVGVNGAGKFSVSDLINSLREVDVNLNEKNLVINEKSSVPSSEILIREKDLTLGVVQSLNSENTSEGMLLIERMEV